jgi:Protein of unknown function (DUF2934)
MATSKTATITPTSAKKSAPKKAATSPAKKAVVKKVAVKKAAVKKPATKKAATKKISTAKSTLSGFERYKMIEVAAYYLAEKKGFTGNAADYWVTAEKDIDKKLSKK